MLKLSTAYMYSKVGLVIGRDFLGFVVFGSSLFFQTESVSGSWNRDPFEIFFYISSSSYIMDCKSQLPT